MRAVLLLEAELFLEAECEVPRSPGRNHDAVGDRLPHFGWRGTGVLRDREGVTQSGGTASDYRAACPDQSLRFRVQNLFILKVDPVPDVLGFADALLFLSHEFSSQRSACLSDADYAAQCVALQFAATGGDRLILIRGVRLSAKSGILVVANIRVDSL